MRLRPFVAAFLILITSPSFAASEYVLVVKILEDDDKAIVQRRNGDQYLIEKGIGCLSLFRYEGKLVVINSPGLFAGIGSHLIIPDRDQTCKIWDSDFIR